MLRRSDPPDPVHLALRALGLELRPEPLLDHRPDLPVLAGHAFAMRGNEIVYRLAHGDPSTVLIPVLRRLEDRQGLRNPFAGLVWFLELLHDRPELGVTRAMGLVSTLRFRDFDDGLSGERLARFLIRWLGGRTIKYDLNDWLYLDLADYRPPRELRPARRVLNP